MWAKRFAKQLHIEDYDSEPEDWTTDNEVCMVKVKFLMVALFMCNLIESLHILKFLSVSCYLKFLW